MKINCYNCGQELEVDFHLKAKVKVILVIIEVICPNCKNISKLIQTPEPTNKETKKKMNKVKNKPDYIG